MREREWRADQGKNSGECGTHLLSFTPSKNMPYLHCFHCHARWEGESEPHRGAVCGKCGNDLRCCRNCRHNAPAFPNECIEKRAEPVAEKTRANLCDFYLPGVKAGGNAPHHTPKQEQAIAAFSALFAPGDKK